LRTSKRLVVADKNLVCQKKKPGSPICLVQWVCQEMSGFQVSGVRCQVSGKRNIEAETCWSEAEIPSEAKLQRGTLLAAPKPLRRRRDSAASIALLAGGGLQCQGLVIAVKSARTTLLQLFLVLRPLPCGPRTRPRTER
jgi:hypothetical protein